MRPKLLTLVVLLGIGSFYPMRSAFADEPKPGTFPGTTTLTIVTDPSVRINQVQAPGGVVEGVQGLGPKWPHHKRPVRTWLATQATRTQTAIRDCLTEQGLACQAHHNDLGCGSFQSEFNFIFGSCRTFCGQTCEPLPPPTLWRRPAASCCSGERDP